ncbi:DUF4974 domain-containing protein [Chitinophaga sp. Mgbs1]|uniref:DUF4974 domain-containing protein n=1 Tax=Chitinophaga solisilvae TaxID=1233460 RepID=A0A433WAR9_9BACT|nr:DUF4974 domain-containing protein [Chitinophaga solisilvae]
MDLQQYKAEDFILNDSFVRYCLRSNESDIQFWENWLERYPHKQEEAAIAREWLFRLGLRITPEEKEAEFGKLKLAVAGAATPPSAFPRKRIIRIAAAVMLPLILAGSWLLSKRQGHTPQHSDTYTIYTAAGSMRREIMLADGSHVILNASSTLKVPHSYNQQDRRLELQGEALFEVAGVENKPFIVNSGSLHVQALGTAFKLRAYPFDTAAAVLLVNGKVRVAQAAATADLQPGEQLTTGKEQPAFRKSTFDTSREMAWRKGQLIFNNASLADIAASLEYWYGIKVVVQPGKYKPIRFNGVFSNKPLQDVLAAVCFVNGLSSSTKNNILYIQAVTK